MMDRGVEVVWESIDRWCSVSAGVGSGGEG